MKHIINPPGEDQCIKLQDLKFLARGSASHVSGKTDIEPEEDEHYHYLDVIYLSK